MVNYLLDTSAAFRAARTPEVRDRLIQIGAARLRMCFPVLAELGMTARNQEDHALMMARYSGAYQTVWSSTEVQQRALSVQQMLARQGYHRAAKLGDLLIAATAELSDLVVLHYDRNFDLIAEVTGQPVEWIVPAGEIS